MTGSENKSVCGCTADERTILILDYDGTLHDSRVVYEPAFRRVMKEITELGWIPEAEYTSEEINYWVGFTAKEMWERFHPELSPEQRETAGKQIGHYMLEDIKAGKGQLYHGVEKTLEELSSRYELLFFSNCDHAYMEAHCKAFGLDRWIDEFYCTGDYGWLPKEEVFEQYIRKSGRKYIAVGDRIKDMLLAQHCGFKAVGCLYGFGSREELEGADICIEDITELMAAVDSIACPQGAHFIVCSHFAERNGD